jgi:hypothetical protein
LFRVLSQQLQNKLSQLSIRQTRNLRHSDHGQVESNRPASGQAKY